MCSVTLTSQDVCFRSKNIPDELAQAFMDTDSEGEFQGFSREECDWRKPMVIPLTWNVCFKTKHVIFRYNHNKIISHAE